MSDGWAGPEAGTTWDEVSAIWDEVREIVSDWADSRAADELDG
ncbi:MAG: hypothetical protein JWQ95_1997 [Sphaerisporangium sp.]|jgi:hypothetical protein|nr:hypothetical protein [Sphaerisporangium sp.]